MPITQADIENIDAAIAAGEKSVSINGKTVTYRSIEELILARSHLQQQLLSTDTSRPMRPRQTLLYHGGRGL